LKNVQAFGKLIISWRQ